MPGGQVLAGHGVGRERRFLVPLGMTGLGGGGDGGVDERGAVTAIRPAALARGRPMRGDGPSGGAA